MKTLTLTFEDKTYQLGFTRDSIRRMEADGFDSSNTSKIFTFTLGLFEGAFYWKHPHMSKDEKLKMFDLIKDKETLYDCLSEMYGEALESLFNDPKDSEGNAVWKKSW